MVSIDNVAFQILGVFLRTGIPIIAAITAIKIQNRLFTKHEQWKGKQLHVNIIQKIVDAFIWITCIAIIGQQFDGFGKAVNTLLAQSGIAALGIQLAAQESLQNLIDGIILQIFKPFDIGDRIQLPEKGITGHVTEMNLRHTVITTFNNTKYIISNNGMSNAIIENSSRNDCIAYPVDVSITYSSDLDKAIEILQRVVSTNEDFIDQRTPEDIEKGVPPVNIVVTGFGDYGINIRATVVQKDIGTSFKACQDIRKAIKKEFDANGIGFPFQTITIDNLKELNIR